MDQEEEQVLDLLDHTDVDQVDQLTGGAAALHLGDDDTGLGLPPPLTPNKPGDHHNDVLHLIHFLQTSNLQEQARRRQEEQDFRERMERARQEDSQRFMDLLSSLTQQPYATLAAPQPPPQMLQQQQPPLAAPPLPPQSQHASFVPPVPHIPPPPGFSTSNTSPGTTPSRPHTTKPTIHPPPILQRDVT